jgi:Flp pilus assembly protein TadG
MKSPKQHSLWRWANAVGSVTVEFALGSLILSVMLIGVIEVGVGLYAKSRVAAAAQAGLREAQIHGFDSTQISTAVQNATSLVNVTATPAPSQFCACLVSGQLQTATCGSTCAAGGAAGSYVNVRAAATYSPLLTLPGTSSSYSLTAAAQARIQ